MTFDAQLTLVWEPLPFLEPAIWHVPAPIRWRPIVDVTPAEGLL